MTAPIHIHPVTMAMRLKKSDLREYFLALSWSPPNQAESTCAGEFDYNELETRGGAL